PALARRVLAPQPPRVPPLGGPRAAALGARPLGARDHGPRAHRPRLERDPDRARAPDGEARRRALAGLAPATAAIPRFILLSCVRGLFRRYGRVLPSEKRAWQGRREAT